MTISLLPSGCRCRPTRRFPAVLTLLLALGAPLAARAQVPAPVSVHDEVFVGSVAEDYLRVLQSVGEVPLYPWSVRSFGPREVDGLAPRDSADPWSDHYDFSPDTNGRFSFGWLRPKALLIYNSAFPYGHNDGAIWAGRGLTSAVQAGFVVRYGPISLVADPIFFRAENRGFTLAPVHGAGASPFADPKLPTIIDLPQRFGDGAYARFDPGQSSLRVDSRFVTVGISTADQQWGPAWDQPLILGDNAAGFPHVFVQTPHPVNLWVGRLHARVEWGDLSQSAYAPSGSVTNRRFMSGLVAVFQPRGVDGLEIGGSRFFNSPWPEGGPSLHSLTTPFESILKSGLSSKGRTGDLSDADNQLASVFARWVFPASGFELYGEYAREDHNWDLRDLILEPDHDSGYVLGLGKSWRVGAERIVVLRGELLNTQVSHLDQVRPQTPFYVHTRMRQGHTQLGQLLGASSGYGGGKTIAAVEDYHPGGKWTLSVGRSLVDAAPTNARTDVMYSGNVGALFFLDRFDLSTGLTAVYELNRYLDADAFNLNVQFAITAPI